ncbi:hypothetical protein E2320_012597 [Naja naja]|nr:hypothetical protein E2320_012597 [Naja naja]
MWSVLCFKVLRKMQRRHSSITDSLPPESLLLGSSAGGGEVFIQMPAAREEGPNRAEAGLYHYRPPHHHYHHSHPRGPSLLHMSGADRHGHAEETPDEPPGTPAPALPEMKVVISWLQDGLPFIVICWPKFVSSTNWVRGFVGEEGGNTLYLLYTFNSQQLYNSLIFLKPNLDKLDFFDLMWMVGITDFVLKYLTIALKCLVLVLPKIILAVKSKRSKDISPLMMMMMVMVLFEEINGLGHQIIR